jgi:NAD(P)-dependent dehydrogenase (short-subunit alcohol dehydrogenase family)
MTTPRTAIVTGASRGIGRAIAVALGREGFHVTINYHANADAAKEAAALVEQAGGKGHIVQADIANSDDRKRMVSETLDAFGPIDLLVNNAGVAPRVRADLLEASEEEYDYVMGANLKGPYFLAQLVANHMIEQPDRRRAIVNIGSISAFAPSVNRGEYCISKAGMGMMTQLFAARLAEHDINVYEIRPGVTETDMTGPVKEKYDKMIFEDGLLPLKRWGQPDDIAKAVIAVASGLLPYSTGQVINVDGGFHIHRL